MEFNDLSSTAGRLTPFRYKKDVPICLLRNKGHTNDDLDSGLQSPNSAQPSSKLSTDLRPLKAERNPVMAKSPDDAMASMIANFQAKTGKTLDQWIKIAAATKLAKHGEIVKFLKSEHGLTHGYANLVALSVLKSSSLDAEPDELVTAQYSGAKSALKPLYDALRAALKKMGSDVELSPKKAYVSVRRAKQFALIQPSTATRLDVGINLKGVEPTGRLEASGSFNTMVSHRVRVTSAAEIDKQLIGWLKQAYEAAQ